MKKYTQIICAVAVIALMSACGKNNQFTINGSFDDEASTATTSTWST